MTSPDGITWTSRTSASDSSWVGIAWNGTVFVAIGSDAMMTSPDGITWTSRSLSTTSSTTYWKEIAWNGLGTGTTLLLPAAGTGSVFAAVSYNGTAMTSLFLKDE